MIKYTPANQLTLENFSHPFEMELSPENRWVKLAKEMPWDNLAAEYVKKLSNNSGRESIDVRMVIGALVAKHQLRLSDRDTVAMISENLYLQYFCGLKSFQSKEPFHPTVFVDIRKRMGLQEFDAWNAQIAKRADALRPEKSKTITTMQKPGCDAENKNLNNPETGRTAKNKGTLKIDATVADQNIVYPTDAGLLGRARKESERMIDLLFKQSNLATKPRDYRRVARKEDYNFSTNRKKHGKTIPKYIRKQLSYLKRNLGYIENLLDTSTADKRNTTLPGAFSGQKDPYPERFPLPYRDQKIYWVLQHICHQQLYMFQEKTHSVENRIVNIYQPHVRPMPRGKDKNKTEFGAKISASESDGISRVEHLSWDNFNEAGDLILQVEEYQQLYGHYPETLLADRIYLNRENRKWLTEKEIKIVGKPLGRPPKVRLSADKRRKLKQQQNQRNLIEGKFGQGKNKYGLSNIRSRRKDTSESWIGAIFFVMNLVKLLKIADQYAIFCALFENYCFVSIRSMKNQFIQTKNLIASQTNQKYLYLTSSAT